MNDKIQTTKPTLTRGSTGRRTLDTTQKLPQVTDVCEYNPKEGRYAFSGPDDGACARSATIRIAEAHLCSDCASLPAFKRRKKVPLQHVQ
jgi:hypothetical protein